MTTKKELFKEVLKRYLKASKQQKKLILDELSANSGMHRKSTIQALNREQMRDPLKPNGKAGHPIIYAYMELIQL